MIEASLAAFINAQAELTTAPGMGFHAFAEDPDTPSGEIKAPGCLVSPLMEGTQELWAIGDAQRKENPRFQVAFYCINYAQARDVEARFRRLIESAKAVDTDGNSRPGIDFKAFADLLKDAGDHLNYTADQPGWFASPTPIVYKNEAANGEPVVVASGYTISSSLGKVTFSVANAPTDKIRATYKIGIIDFTISGVAKFPQASEADVAENPSRYVVAFSLEAFFYIKTNANRWL